MIFGSKKNNFEYKMKKMKLKMKLIKKHTAKKIPLFIYLHIQIQCKIQNNGWIRIIHLFVVNVYIAICFVMKFIRQQRHNQSLISLFVILDCLCTSFRSLLLVFLFFFSLGVYLCLPFCSPFNLYFALFRSQYANSSLCFQRV